MADIGALTGAGDTVTEGMATVTGGAIDAFAPLGCWSHCWRFRA